MPSQSITIHENYRSPSIGATQVRLLERLCNACAVSGDESEVRAIVLEHIKPYASEFKVDALGNVLAIRRGQGAERLRVMVAAHMDEVGFMIIQDEGEGIYRFDTVGGLDSRHLAGKAVQVGKKHLPGVIGLKAVHLTSAEERRQAPSLEGLRIDLGPGNSKVQLGERATFATSFQRIGPSLRAKALDDRLGVAGLIELFRQAPENIDLLAAFTVQEEVGLRGAKVAAYAMQPDLAIALDCTPAYDLPHWERHAAYPDAEIPENASYNTRLGAGPAIYIADRATLSDPRLVGWFAETGDALGIPYQFRQPGGGGTDAGAIHQQRTGIPSISISTPGRYLHTPASIARLDDWKNTIALVHAALAHLSPDLLAIPR